MKKLSLFFLFLVFLSLLSASVVDYSFNETVGVYEEFADGTVSTATGDDGTETVSLPFTFIFDNLAYTDGKISVNGYFQLGTSGVSSPWTNNLSSTTNKPFVCPLWDDLYSTSGTTQISYKTTGNAPSRIFVVQWKNVKWKGSAGTLQNFQVKFYETTNNIEFVYGSMLTPGGSSISASIGIKDLDSNFISVTPATPATISSVTGNNAIATVNGLTAGTTYRFGAPVIAGPGLPLNPVPANNATGTNVAALELAWTNPATATAVDVYFSTDNALVTNLDASALIYEGPSVSSFVLPNTLSYNTNYYWRVVEHDASSATNGSIWHLTTTNGIAITPVPANYATSIDISGLVLDWADVNGATSYLISIGTATGATDIANDVVCSGSSYTFAANALFGTTYYWKVKTVGIPTVTGTEWKFTTVNGLPSNPQPANAVVNVGIDNLILNWNDVAGATGYTLNLGTTAGNYNLLTDLPLTGSEYAFSSPLNLGENYYWKISVLNGAQVITGPEWHFTTVFSPIAAYPYHEGFDVTFLPVGWSATLLTQPGSTAPAWSGVTAGADPICAVVDGTTMAKFNSYNCQDGSTARLAMRPFTLTGISAPLFSFSMYHDTGYPAKTEEGIIVQISTDGANWTDLAPLYVRYAATNGWLSHEIDLSAYLNQTVYIGFLGKSQYGNNIFIDNINLISNQSVPTATSAINPLEDAANVAVAGSFNWASAAGATGYKLSVGTSVSNFNDIINAQDLGNVTSFAYSSLLSYATAYYWQVVPYNAVGEAADCPVWSFTTINDPAIVAFPYLQDFENDLFPPAGWDNQLITNTILWVRNVGGESSTDPAPLEANGHNAYFQSSTRGSEARLTLPMINFTGVSAANLSFMHAQKDWSGDQDELRVYYKSSEAAAWTLLAEYTEDVPTWEQRSIELPNLSATYYISFVALADYGYGVCIDNLEIAATASEVSAIIPANDTNVVDFPGTGVQIQFPTGNPQELNLTVSGQNNPVTVGALPVERIWENYWHVTVNSGTVVNSYSITFDLSDIEGVGNFNALIPLYRANNTQPWILAGTLGIVNYNQPFITISGLTGFSEFAIGGNTGDGNTLPVELASFTAMVTQDTNVELTWLTHSEVSLFGYNVYRSEKNAVETATQINPNVIAATNTSQESRYTYTDSETNVPLTMQKEYYYWLQSIDLDGTISFHGPIAITVRNENQTPQYSTITGIESVYPNPFNPKTSISFSVKEGDKAQITVYNILGQKVKSFGSFKPSTKNYVITWDGKNDHGQSTASGVYFISLKSLSSTSIKKVMLVK